MPTIKLQNAQKSYAKNGQKAVSNLDLEIANGDFMCLLGPSGCGKTTTLRMIAGLENLSDGELLIDDRIVDSVQKGIFIPPEKREMGLVFQSYALWPHLTIERNTDFGLRLRKVPKLEREAQVERVMKALDIEQYRDRYPSQLSGGQQQRVALARMLAINPGILLLDEPLSNLDARLRLEMRAELKRIHNAFKTTIVFVTHDQWEAMTLATTIAVMDKGTLQQIGTPDDIYNRPANRFVAEFVGNPPINIINLSDANDKPIAQDIGRYLAQYSQNSNNIAALGFRPEAIEIAQKDITHNENVFKADMMVTGILPTGGNWIIELNKDGHTVFASTHQPPNYETGSKVAIAIQAKNQHGFDQTGSRVAQLQ
ncbi:ABC transporter ATP-binding protein [Bartonella sp. HY038]|uniref:ABC transporter ATP-binding protein n=1 Tax=Bartonella sp. HY038 TaxID=2759660 RepID=UPI0015F85FEF|nr:ABC transporter ATP-binding protein [Bartonella sp. HY038]